MVRLVIGGGDGHPPSVDAALQAVRDLRQGAGASGPIEIVMPTGVTWLDRPVVLGPEHLGDAQSPLILRGADADTPSHVVGGVRITGFEPTAENPAVYRADLNNTAIADSQIRALFCNGIRQHIARYPNHDPANPVGGGFLYREGDPAPIYELGHGEADRFVCRDPRLATWSRLDEIELFIFPRYNWNNNIIPLQRYDADTGAVVLSRPASYAIYPNDRFYFRNVREELDAPGEWYHDRQERAIYFYPPVPIDQAEVVVPTLASLFDIRGAEGDDEIGRSPGMRSRYGEDPERFSAGHVTLEGLTLEICSGDAVRIARTAHCTVRRCTIRNAGRRGVVINSGARCQVRGCDIHATGSGGISVAGGLHYPSHEVCRPCDHVIENNYVHHTGLEDKASGAINVNGVGVHVRHNLIHDVPRDGIRHGGREHRIEFNRIRDIATETSDCAAIGCCHRDYTLRGTKIRFNHITDALGFGRDEKTGQWHSRYYCFGVYLDDQSSGIEITGNLVARSSREGVFIHGGSNNVIENNVLVDNARGNIGLRRRAVWRDLMEAGSNLFRLRGNVVRRNVCVQHQRDQPNLDLWMWTEHYYWPGSLGTAPLPGDGLAEIPETLQHDGAALQPRTSEADELDLHRLLGYPQLYRQWIYIACAFRELHSDAPQTVRWLVGIEKAARIWVNGEQVFDNLADDSPEGPAAKNHVIELPLKAGRNIINIRCTAGFTSWRIVPGVFEAGSPLRWSGPWHVFAPIHSIRRHRDDIAENYPPMPDALMDNHLSANLYWNTQGSAHHRFIQANYDLPAWKAMGIDALSVEVDPGLDAGMHLPTDSPARALGHLRLPLDATGPYPSADRVTWPIVEASGIRERPVPQTS